MRTGMVPLSLVQYLCIFTPCILALYWSSLVYRIVPEPYLDEVFHIRQAQAYLQNQWRVWDPKITTPPALYVVSYVQMRLAQLVGYDKVKDRDYRSINSLVTFELVFVLLSLVRRISSHERSPGQTKRGSTPPTAEVHTVVNIMLFPPLFFFYGLYYTDILSVRSVLIVYYYHLDNRRGCNIAAAGLISLAFRQTNVFWVAIYIGGLELQRVLPRRIELNHSSTYKKWLRGHSSDSSFWAVVERTWISGRVYDPAMSDASMEDYIQTAISYPIAVLSHWRMALQSVTPPITILLAFASFIVWNGGVVLGDKSNHIATIHLAQMLYIWPFIAFFSLPLVLPYLIVALLPYSYLPSSAPWSPSNMRKSQLILAVPTMGLMSMVVRYNTIVHPFTLADNRHYMFYVFRLLLRQPSIKYLAIPVYYLCMHAVLLAATGTSEPPKNPDSSYEKIQDKQTSEQVQGSMPQKPKSNQRASWLLIWLATTVLSLCTAPLVEPRYCILPWIMWRLHIPLPTSISKPQAEETQVQKALRIIYDHRLWLETLWLLLINAVTGYMFLYRGFGWEQEPGNVQRFMW